MFLKPIYLIVLPLVLWFASLSVQAAHHDSVEAESSEVVKPSPAAVVAKTSAKVNINQADAQALSSILNGIGIKKAEAIVEYRTKYGPFTNVDQLSEVPGIGESLLERNKSKLEL